MPTHVTPIRQRPGAARAGGDPAVRRKVQVRRTYLRLQRPAQGTSTAA